ncbi:MAG: phage major capsid protein [Lachnospiraceae bacterium]|nr:phage major capsid protein [Lachnospiraceae bacterium]
MKNEMNISLKERVDALEREINGEKLQAEMLRKAKQYRKDYRGYLRNAEITDSLKVGKESEGGYLVPDEMEEGLVEALEQNNVIRKLSTVVSTNAPRKVDTYVKGPTGYWVDEGGPITFSDAEFYQVVLDAHKCGAMMGVTEELLEDSGFDIEKYIIEELGECVGDKEEEAFVNGNGTTMPRGFLLDAEVGAEANELSGDALITLQSSVRGKIGMNAVWVMSEEAEQQLRKIKNFNGRPLWQPDMTKGAPDRIFGKPVYVCKAMPKVLPGNCPIAYGDFSYYWIGERGKRSIKRLGERYADRGIVAYRYFHRVDGKLILPDAIKTLKIAA